MALTATIWFKRKCQKFAIRRKKKEGKNVTRRSKDGYISVQFFCLSEKSVNLQNKLKVHTIL